MNTQNFEKHDHFSATLATFIRLDEKCVLWLTSLKNARTPENIMFSGVLGLTGGESGIRTPVTLTREHDFQSCAFDHSANSPYYKYSVFRVFMLVCTLFPVVRLRPAQPSLQASEILSSILIKVNLSL
jgi:hypothetical protein